MKPLRMIRDERALDRRKRYNNSLQNRQSSERLETIIQNKHLLGRVSAQFAEGGGSDWYRS